MNITLEGRVALVTGGSRGIGRAIALMLAQAGADVAVNYCRDEKAAQETVVAIEALGRRAKAYRAAVENADENAAMVNSLINDFGGVGILINNGGIGSQGRSVADTDPAELERVIRIHALGPHHLCQLVLPHMRKEKRGDIIMISSIATLYNQANGGPYNMAKAAMEALALTLAKEERKHGIRTNIVSPSLTVTDMGRRLTKAVTGGKDISELDARSPFGHVSTPEDVASVVTFLVSEANSYANGQKVNVDGGGTQ